ncbi:uncharacterized protein RMCC_5822 [Mycolicibacterium canariasense]|uniref:Uncharacterized protein n=1 Tax=Mycolicibacterium canariasense TaxID=228230 RepID=A0A100WHS8_MYCCR|nr:hypothetical protein [Mycolicibacterium canariasense]MCV7210199.1 hypothetical protein [Mycolicibacterium canariasense]GAS98857.1 uncharacterized protein RMCC_5822 [Mycolicibacterium canariasense]
MYAHEVDEWQRWRHGAPEIELDVEPYIGVGTGLTCGDRSDAREDMR